MIITFAKDFFGHGPVVESTARDVGLRHYKGNVYAAITWSRGRRVRFTLETRDAFKIGSKTAASGRHMRKASWEAHRDVMRALFELDPAAVIRTALATYNGKADFEKHHAATANANVGGSMLNPNYIVYITAPKCCGLPAREG